MQHYTYMLINLACVFVPLLASFYPKHSFLKELKWFLPANVVVAIFFLIWDEIFTQNKFWGFNPDYLIGMDIGSLPLEEVLFFICIPYACVFTFFALQHLVKTNPLQRIQQQISWGLILILMMVLIIADWRWYTGLTALFNALFLGLMLWLKRDLSYHYLSYFLIIPFFFISNGILTGSFVKNPIVWYNNQENLAIRLVTIPIEDIFYGMLLIFMNIELYLYIKQKLNKANSIKINA